VRESVHSKLIYTALRVKMLDNLDQVPWSTLQHAYGEAGDIPNLIRALVSNDPNEREWAQEMLEMGPFHQGSLYSCTPFVVRFLLELLQENGVVEKPWILRYVSRVLAAATYNLSYPEAQKKWEVEYAAAEQILFEIRSQLPLLLTMLDNHDIHVRMSLLRLLGILKVDLPNVEQTLAERLNVETDESIRAALAFCLSLVMDMPSSQAIQLILAATTESPLVRIAAGFGVISALKERTPEDVVTAFCVVIASHFDALDEFEGVYQEYLAPLGARGEYDRLFECLWYGLSDQQKDQIVRALLSLYAQLPTVQCFGRRTRRGYAYYLETMVRLAFPEGKLPPETTIRDLNDTQRRILEAFQQYDMPSIEWNVWGHFDYRTELGFTFKSETDFLDFMSGERPARYTN
jgi:hypothetical protein